MKYHLEQKNMKKKGSLQMVQFPAKDFSIDEYNEKNDLLLQKCDFQEEELYEYYMSLKVEMNQLLSAVNKGNAFETVLKVLGIDAKIQLLKFFAHDHDEALSVKYIIKTIEDEYPACFAESLGYNKNDSLPNSLLFHVK